MAKEKKDSCQQADFPMEPTNITENGKMSVGDVKAVKTADVVVNEKNDKLFLDEKIDKEIMMEEDLEYDETASCTERYPKSIYFIIGMEFCERYCYYGMKAILIIYFTEILLMSDDLATVLYHSFVLLCYLTPVGGAMISDGFWGKYKTIFWISWIYLAGCVLMSLSSIPAVQSDDPNLILREDVQCFDNDCYPLAYGVPAALLFVAIVIFVVGRYTVGYVINPGKGNVVWEVCKTIGRAIMNKIRYRKAWKGKYEHWLEYASDKYSKQLINDSKCLLHILVMYIPLPVFWALFDQVGSRWTLQATQMDGSVGNITIKPDQMQVLNPLFMILLIPIFDNCVYPLLRKCGIRCTYLQRMTWGLFFASAAYVIAGILQVQVSKTVRVPPCTENPGETGITIINAAPCDIMVSSAKGAQLVPYAEYGEYIELSPGEYEFSIESNCTQSATYVYELEECEAYRMLIGQFPVYEESSNSYVPELDVVLVPDKYDKPDRGMVFASFVFTRPSESEYYEVDFYSNDFSYTVNATRIPNTQFRITEWDEYEPGSYSVCVHETVGSLCAMYDDYVYTYNGAVYTFVAQLSDNSTRVNDKATNTILVQHETVPANTVNILCQIPQYFVLTTGEIMFSVTGLEFSYAQAPSSMKSTLQACWLLSIAVGNLIVIIQTIAAPPRSMAIDFFMYAALMFVVAVIYVFMSIWYTYIDPLDYIVKDDSSSISSDSDDDDEKKKKSATNSLNNSEDFARDNPIDATEGED
ncbi:solute carrier family 15 member 1-like [Saccoglossus kowalevskii]